MKKFLIHFFGGITKEECAVQSQQSYDEGRLMSFTGLKLYAESMNGYNADDWCKLMYAHICCCIKRLEEETTVPDFRLRDESSSPSGENTEQQ